MYIRSQKGLYVDKIYMVQPVSFEIIRTPIGVVHVEAKSLSGDSYRMAVYGSIDEAFNAIQMARVSGVFPEMKKKEGIL